MKSLRQTTVLIFLIAGLSASFAQNNFRSGKIITNAGDTLVGLIESTPGSKLNKACRFKQHENSQVQTYTPENIQAFVTGNGMRKFISASLPNVSGAVFLEVLCEGKLNLYYLDKNAVQYYIQKKGEPTIHSLPYERMERYVDNGYAKHFKIIETTFHMDTLRMLMQDKPFLYPKIEKIQAPGKKNLIEIVSKYNADSSGPLPQTESKTIFASNQPELLRSGKMNLYLRTDVADEQYFYIQKGTGTRLIELPFTKMKELNYQGILIHSYSSHTTNHMDTLKKYMADAMLLYPSIEEISTPTKTKLLKLIDEYNSYTDENTYIQKHTIKRLPLNVDVVPGFNYVVANLSNHVVKFGSLLDIGFINSNKHLYLKSGLFVFTGYTPLTDRYYDPASAEYEYNYYPPATTFLIPLQIEFRFAEKAIQPLLSVGYNLYLFDEIKPYNVSLLPVISPGINFQMGQRFSVRLNIEFEFKNKTLIAYIPETFKRAGVFFGLHIKL